MESIPTAIGPVSEEESAIIAGASLKRRREFAAGRNLARAALSRFGAACDSLVATGSRYPKWPDGYAGSISHNDEFVAVAVTRIGEYRGLGIDLESCDAVGRDLFESILTSEEQYDVSSSHDMAMATTVFCCKEAIFKAVYPIYHEFIDFLDVRVSLDGDSFFATGAQGKASAHAIESGVGHVWNNENLVLTLFLVKHNTAGARQCRS